MSGIIYDIRGNPITSPETRQMAEALLREYVHKYHSRFQDWVRAHGTRRPPIYFDIGAKEWVWADEQ